MVGTVTLNLADKIKSQLPAELVNLMRVTGGIAQRQSQNLYLVGGVVRDLMLGRPNLDLDLVIEGDALSLAKELAAVFPGKMVTHPRFGTAKLQGVKWSVDMATARSETYARPGALPTVRPGTIKDDLFRRDFTINAIAIELNPGRYGQLLDLYGGNDDIEHKLVRILHEKSFIDDATRIWRALRYEQRLGFRLEPLTLKLLKRHINYLDMISGDRIRHELELALKEECPEKVLRRADELGVLVKLHPALRGDDWLAEKLAQARQVATEVPSVGLYLALLAYRLTGVEVEQLISYLKLPRTTARNLRDTVNLRDKLGLLRKPGMARSKIYFRLNGYFPPAITANAIATDSAVVRERLNLFLAKLRYVRPTLTGADLKAMGVMPGPRMKEILNRLLEARLDGRVTSKRGEAELVKTWLNKWGGAG